MRYHRWRRLGIAVALELIPAWAALAITGLLWSGWLLAGIDESLDDAVSGPIVIAVFWLLGPFAAGGFGWLYTRRNLVAGRSPWCGRPSCCSSTGPPPQASA